MSLAVVLSRGLAGLDAPLVTVEVHLAGGLPAFNLVGLPDTEVKESRDRVRAALQNAQFDFPARKITVNLAPADLPKESGRFDLPIAVGILAATGQIPGDALTQYEFAGELALGGALRPIRGALPMALSARRDGRAFVLPSASAGEAALVQGAVVYPASTLLAVCAHLTRRELLAPLGAGAVRRGGRHARARSRRRARPGAREASAHHRRGRRTFLLMIGPPGTGKSMLAQRLPGILPPLAEDEALATAAIASLAGRFTMATGERALIARRITRRARWRWWVAAAIRVPARSRSRTTGCCSSMSCPNGIAACSRCCASRWSRA